MVDVLCDLIPTGEGCGFIGGDGTFDWPDLGPNAIRSAIRGTSIYTIIPIANALDSSCSNLAFSYSIALRAQSTSSFLVTAQQVLVVDGVVRGVVMLTMAESTGVGILRAVVIRYWSCQH